MAGGPATLLAWLATGVFISLLGQFVTSLRAYHVSAQLIPLCKYSTTFLLTSVRLPKLCIRQPGTFASPPAPSGGRVALCRGALAIGALDLLAYCFTCFGFAYVGVASATPVFAAFGQLFNAALHRWFHRRQLSQLQHAGVALVTVGLVIRSLSPAALRAAASALLAAPWQQLEWLNGMRKTLANAAPYVVFDSDAAFGFTCLAASAGLYSALGALYQASTLLIQRTSDFIPSVLPPTCILNTVLQYITFCTIASRLCGILMVV